ncbi:MAG: recO [Clostridiales bacterium]|jgi:DNA repair protein RecO (recombination protein O)|nr:recO [Clostridiales bacterium]
MVLSLTKVQGIVLKSINLGESDKIITIYTDILGKIDMVVHGARKQKSKFMASTQPFCYCEYVIFKGKNLYTLSESSINESFQGILLDFGKLIYGSYFLELVDGLSEKDNKNVSILALLLKTLYLLDSGNIDNKLLRLTFDFKAISLSGYMPQVNYCIKCRRKIQDKGFFSISEGGIACTECKSLKSSYILNEEAIQLLHKIKLIKLEDLRNIKYEDKVLALLQNIFLSYIQYQTGREYKTLSLIKNI